VEPSTLSSCDWTRTCRLASKKLGSSSIFVDSAACLGIFKEQADIVAVPVSRGLDAMRPVGAVCVLRAGSATECTNETKQCPVWWESAQPVSRCGCSDRRNKPRIFWPLHVPVGFNVKPFTALRSQATSAHDANVWQLAFRSMDIFPVLRPMRNWPDAQNSAGCEIPTNGMLRFKKAWWACGAPMQLFDDEIKPTIDALLRNMDDAHSDIDLRLYMVGRKKEASRPIIFVCCRNATVRKTAESCIRASDLLQKYPGFGLGKSSLPLEGFVKVLHGEDEGDSPILAVPTPDHDTETSDLKVLALEREPHVGRKLLIRRSPDGPNLHTGTGGPVILVGGKLYQLTSGHICHEYVTQDEGEGDDNESLDFDGKWDEEDEDDENPDGGGSPPGYETTSIGSRTPPELEEERESSPSSLLGLFDSTAISPQRTEESSGAEQSQFQRSEEEHEVVSESRLIAVGSIEPAEQKTADGILDYALVSVENSDIKSPLNVACLPKGLGQESVSIAELAAPQMDEETRVVVVTSSQGPLFGTLMPTFAYCRPAGSSFFQKTQVMKMEHELLQGDSGSAVIDGGSGNWHGHIVRGCPGTRLAFLLAAVDIFENIQQVFKSPATLLTGEMNIHGPGFLVPRITISPATPNTTSRATTTNAIFEGPGSPSPQQAEHDSKDGHRAVEDIIATDESIILLMQQVPNKTAAVKQCTCSLCQSCGSIHSFLLRLLGEALHQEGLAASPENHLDLWLPNWETLLRAVRDWSQEIIHQGVEHSPTGPGQKGMRMPSEIENHFHRLADETRQRRADLRHTAGQPVTVFIEIISTTQLLQIDKEDRELMTALKQAYPPVWEMAQPTTSQWVRPRYTPWFGGSREVEPLTWYAEGSALVDLDDDEMFLYMRYLRPASDGRRIPPAEKWTKIARELVSVYAVHETQRRYDARPDFVVILGVLSAKEILQLVRRTAVIKSARKLAQGLPT